MCCIVLVRRVLVLTVWFGWGGVVSLCRLKLLLRVTNCRCASTGQVTSSWSIFIQLLYISFSKTLRVEFVMFAHRKNNRKSFVVWGSCWVESEGRIYIWIKITVTSTLTRFWVVRVFSPKALAARVVGSTPAPTWLFSMAKIKLLPVPGIEVVIYPLLSFCGDSAVPACYIHVRRNLLKLPPAWPVKIQSEVSTECDLVLSLSHFQCPVVSWRSSICLRLLPRLPVTYLSTFPSITCSRRQFLCKVWPIKLTFFLFMWPNIFSRVTKFVKCIRWSEGESFTKFLCRWISVESCWKI